MNKKNLCLLLISFLIPFTNIFGQVECHMTSNKKSVLIGEPFEVSVKVVVHNSNTFKSLDFSTILNSINTLFAKDTTHFESVADIELLSSAHWKSFSFSEPYPLSSMPLLKTGNSSTYENTFTCAIYNPGVFVLNLPTLDSILWTDSTSIKIEVTVPLLDSLSILSQDTLYPIKPIIVEPSNWTDYLMYVYILAGILLVYFLIKYAKNKPAPIKEILIIETIKLPHEVALEKLENLEKSKLAELDDAKEFQSQLTYIFREYVENQFNIKALEMSTSECLAALKQKIGISQDLLYEAGNILNMADLVKFAKAQTLHDTHASYLSKVREFIQATIPSS